MRALKGEVAQRELRSPIRPVAQSTLDPVSRKRYICQIVQLGVQSPDRVFHDYLYRTLINLGLEKELLEFGGPDLVPFLQNACREPLQEVDHCSKLVYLEYFFEQLYLFKFLNCFSINFWFRYVVSLQWEPDMDRNEVGFWNQKWPYKLFFSL